MFKGSVPLTSLRAPLHNDHSRQVPFGLLHRLLRGTTHRKIHETIHQLGLAACRVEACSDGPIRLGDFPYTWRMMNDPRQLGGLALESSKTCKDNERVSSSHFHSILQLEKSKLQKIDSPQVGQDIHPAFLLTKLHQLLRMQSVNRTIPRS